MANRSIPASDSLLGWPGCGCGNIGGAQPSGEIKPPPTLAPAPRVTDLAGKKIGIYWNGKQGGNNFWDVAEELLREKLPTATILRFRGPFDLGERLAGTLAKEVDTFIYGVGD